MNKWIIFIIVYVVILTSCQRNPLKPDISAIKVNLKISRLEQDLFKVTPATGDTLLPALKRKYGDFYILYVKNILALGDPDEPTFPGYLQEFLGDSIRKSTKLKVDSVFKNLDGLDKKLQTAFRYFHYYFPGKTIPKIYTIMSGFNQSMVTTQNALGISLDNYLGSKCRFYRMLGLPDYKMINMTPEKIPTDALYAWAISEFQVDSNEGSLIEEMIREGKLMYFLDAVFPDEPDYLKIGYLPEKIIWCKNHEAGMWTYLIENKLLFTNDRMNIRRFIGAGPFTNPFTNESPGKTGVWIGWQIVRKYMSRHPEITLPSLMAEKDYQKILNQSGYDPQ